MFTFLRLWQKVCEKHATTLKQETGIKQTGPLSANEGTTKCINALNETYPL